MTDQGERPRSMRSVIVTGCGTSPPPQPRVDLAECPGRDQGALDPLVEVGTVLGVLEDDAAPIGRT